MPSRRCALVILALLIGVSVASVLLALGADA